VQCSYHICLLYLDGSRPSPTGPWRFNKAAAVSSSCCKGTRGKACKASAHHVQTCVRLSGGELSKESKEGHAEGLVCIVMQQQVLAAICYWFKFRMIAINAPSRSTHPSELMTKSMNSHFARTAATSNSNCDLLSAALKQYQAHIHTPTLPHPLFPPLPRRMHKPVHSWFPHLLPPAVSALASKSTHVLLSKLRHDDCHGVGFVTES